MQGDEIDDRSVMRSEDPVGEVAEGSTDDETECNRNRARAGVADHDDKYGDYHDGYGTDHRSPSLGQAEAAPRVVLELQIELPDDVDVAARKPVYRPGLGQLIDGDDAGGYGSSNGEPGLRAAMARRRLA